MKLQIKLLLVLTILVPAALLADQRTSRSPVLIVEVNNSGEVRLALTVYSDGGAHLAKRDVEHPEGELCEAIIPSGELEALQGRLRDLGTMRLSDLAEIPGLTRKTLSFFSGPDQRGLIHGNTFSYSRAEGSHLAVIQAVNALLAAHFGDCE